MDEILGNLVPLSSERAREIGSIGGKAISVQKQYAQLQNHSRRARCRNCKAICVFKKPNMDENPRQVCIVPEARAKALWNKMPVMSEEVLDKLSSETLQKLRAYSKSSRDLKLLHDAIMDKKKVDYPKTNELQGNLQTPVIIKLTNINMEIDGNSTDTGKPEAKKVPREQN